MKKASRIIVIATTALLSAVTGCKDRNANDPAYLIEGQYQVSHYVVGNDTLISPEKGNLSPYSNLSIEVRRKNDEMVTVYLKPTDNGGSQTTDGIYVKRDESGIFRLTMPTNSINTDFGYADGQNIFLNGAGWNPQDDQVFYTVIKGVKVSN